LSPPVSEVPLDSLRIDHLKADLRGRSVRGGILTVIGQGVGFILQIISTVVLARLLTPADYGLVAMVAAVSGLVQIFADAGLSQATIQRPEVNHRQVSTLFWINVGFSFLLMVVLSALAPALAWFYGEPRVALITLVVAGTFLFGGLTVQHDALLRRQMRFFSLTVRDIAASVVGVRILGSCRIACGNRSDQNGALLVPVRLASRHAELEPGGALHGRFWRPLGGRQYDRLRGSQCG
jgi:uncharacterized membrane protein